MIIDWLNGIIFLIDALSFFLDKNKMKLIGLLKKLWIFLALIWIMGAVLIILKATSYIVTGSVNLFLSAGIVSGIYGNTSGNKMIFTDKSFITKEQAQSYLNVSSGFISEMLGKDQHGAVKSVMFLKTHKTAGSTLQNLFFRYAALRDLKVALPVYSTSFVYPVVKFHRDLVLQTHTFSYACCDFLLHHLVLDIEEVRAVTDSAFHVTILRDPVDLFISAYRYYFFDRCMNGADLVSVDLSRYSHLNVSTCPQIRMQIANIQSFDLGFILKHALINICYFEKFLQKVDSFFDVVLITELFDESLIVLKHMLKWNFDDVAYLKHNIQYQRSDKYLLSADQIQMIDEFNHVDRLLYEHFKRKLLTSIKALKRSGVAFNEEVIALRARNQQILEACIEGVVLSSQVKKDPQRYMFAGYGFTNAYQLKKEALNNTLCRAMALPEVSFDEYFKGMFPDKENRPKTKRELQDMIKAALYKVDITIPAPCSLL